MSAPGPVTILVVEDDLGLSELIRDEFAQRGWDTVPCHSGLEAVAALAGTAPTLVLLDYSLPDMTGAGLLDLVQMPPFIVTTGAGDERIAVEMMKRGALDYLVKDALFLETLPRVVELAIRHVDTERRLADAEAELRSAQEGLRQAQKMESLGLMAGGIAHDFNNLFQGLQGNLEVAIRKVPGGTARPCLDKALALLAKASTLTHRILDFTGKSLRQTAILDLDTLVRDCLKPLEALPGADVRFQVEAGLPPIQGDGDQLGQVVTGLVLNAREAQKFTGAPILVSAGMRIPDEPGLGAGVWVQVPATHEPSVCLTVEDSGSGMSLEVLERAFDPFFTTRNPGRGLGLSAALGILRGHGAGLWVSTTPGQGTIFRLYFTPTAPAEDVPAPALLPSMPSRRTILLVDDDEDLQDTLGEFLRDVLGHPLLQARDGVEAVTMYRQSNGSIGMVLMDAMMPRLSGPEAFKQILAFDPQARGYLCSGFSEEAGTRTARDCGFLGFLKKPFPLKALEAALQHAMAL